MKTIVEISRLSSGASDKGPWVRISGRDHRGKAVVAVAFSARAEKILSDLGNLVPEGEDIATRRLIVEFSGEFRDGRQIVREGKPVTRGDGSPVLSRSFHVDTWNILTGPTLELTRIRRDGEAVIAKAESKRAAGDVSGAYLLLAEFAAKACNRPLDLVIKDDFDDEEFGDPQPPAASPEAVHASAVSPAQVSSPAVDPEAAAAAAYSLEDYMTDPAGPSRDTASPTSALDRNSSAETASRSNDTSGRDVLDDETPMPTATASNRRSFGRPLGGTARHQEHEASSSETPAVEAEAPAPMRRRIGLGMRR